MIKSLLRKGLSAANAVLPGPAARLVGEHGFALYRTVLRGLYFGHVIRAHISRNEDEIFRRSTVHNVMPYSLVGTGGLEATVDAVRSVEDNDLIGCVVECGVAQGGCAALMAMVIRRFGYRRTMWLFDSFEGLPEPGEKDYINGKTGTHIRELPKGSCLGTVDQVESLLFETLSLDRSKIRLVKGWFENTLPSSVIEIGDIAVLRIDADWYDSVMTCLDNLYGRVVSGGYIIIDDYGTCFGAKKAVDEFLGRIGSEPEMISDGRGGIVFQKL